MFSYLPKALPRSAETCQRLNWALTSIVQDVFCAQLKQSNQANMEANQLEQIKLWLISHRNEITRIRPRLRGSIVSYVPRKGWGPGLHGAFDSSPGMWSALDAYDPLDAMFRELGIPVDAPL